MSKPILIVNAGGTAGSCSTPRGLEPYPKGAFEPILRDALKEAGCDIAFEYLELERLIDSSQARFSDWTDMGRLIADLYGDFDGFVPLHGTDTMDHAVTNLSFMFENLGKNVGFAGGQHPLKPSANAEVNKGTLRNIWNALRIAQEGRIREVTLSFNEKILRGVRTFKYSAESDDAFDSPNLPPLAKFDGDQIYYNDEIAPVESQGDFKFLPHDTFPFTALEAAPGQFGHHLHLAQYIKQAGEVIFIRAFGNGNLPHTSEVEAAIKSQADRGNIVIVGTQCPQGRVDFRYAAGSWLRDLDVVSALDMTDAAIRAKVYHLLQKSGYNTGLSGTEEKKRCFQEIREGFNHNLRGEVTLEI